MAIESTVFAVIIVVVIVSVIGYNIFQRTFGSQKNEVPQTQFDNVSEIRPQSFLAPMHSGIPNTVPAMLMLSQVQQDYPGYNQTITMQTFQQDQTGSSYVRISNSNHLVSNQDLSILQNDVPTTNYQEDNIAPYAEPLPAYAVEADGKLPPYRDNMHV